MTVPTHLDELNTKALEALDRYVAQVSSNPNVDLPDASEMRAADAALAAAVLPLLPAAVLAADDRVRLAKDATFGFGVTDAAVRSYQQASDELWELLALPDGGLLPLVTIRVCCPGKSCGTTVLVLTGEPGSLYSYRRLSNHDIYFGPATVDELRRDLADTRWKP